MATEVYTFHVTYNGLEEKLWRTIEISSRYPLDRLGYCILATFDTMACHLFSFEYQNQRFCLPVNVSQNRDMKSVRLEQLRLKAGESMEMVYDFGTEQHFHLVLKEISPMKRGRGNHYPWILAGEGRGILDGYPSEILAESIARIDLYGKTEEEIHYKEYRIPWDYRDYSLESDNILLKGEIQTIEENYFPLWE